MSEPGLISKVVHATALPALAVTPETGTILEANHAAAVLLRESDLQHSDLSSIFPHCHAPLRQKIIEAQAQGSSQIHTTIHDAGIHTLSLAVFDADSSLLLMTIHAAPQTITTSAGEVSLTDNAFPPIRLEPSWQLMLPRDQLHQLLAQVLAAWRVEAAAILLSHASHTVVIDQAGKPLAWRELPLALYGPLERSLQRGARPCVVLNDHRVRLAPLFVESDESAWGAIAFTITAATEAASDNAALSLASLVSAVLAHAHQKHAIATHDQQRQRAVAHRDHLIRTAQRGILLLNPAGEIEVINDFACEFLNWKREDVRQRPIANLLATLGNLGTKLGSALLGAPRSRVELSGRLERRNMRGRDLDVVLEPIAEEPGAYWLLLNDPAMVTMTGAVPDETSQTLGRIHQLNVTVHEMKTPLTGLVWQLAVLDDMIQKSSLPPESPIFTTLATVRQKVDQALSIMDDVKNWVSTGQKPNFDFCDLKLIAEEAIVAVEQARRGRLHRPIKIRRAFESLVPLVEGDGRRLHQMLTNLIKNAAEAITKDDGEVEVLLRPLRRDQLATYNLPPEKQKILNNGVELRVRDTGQGMSKAQLQRIFDPEVSFKLGGTGIGLWVVRTVVEQHGGEILVDSDIGSGTTFTILLPQRVEGIVDS